MDLFAALEAILAELFARIQFFLDEFAEFLQNIGAI